MGDKRTLSTKLRKSVDDLFDQGVTDAREVVDRLDGKVNAQQVGGLLTLWKRRMNGTAGFNAPRREPETRAFSPSVAAHVPASVPASGPAGRPDEKIETPGSPVPRLDAASAAAKTPPAPPDAFEFGTPQTAGSASLGFGQPLVEYHLRRLGPALMGFLGVEGDPINEDIIGRKHGGGDYEVTKYQNGNRYGYPVRIKIAESQYGPPKNARSGAQGYPRLRAGAEDDPSVEPRDRAHSRAGSGELSDTVQAFKAINDIVKENKEAGRPEASSAESKIVDRALDVAMGKNQERAQGGAELIITFYQQQEAKRESEAREAEARWTREQTARENEFKRQQQADADRRTADLAEMKARHEQETTRIRQENADREKRDKDQRDFVERMDKEREGRMQKAIEETQGQIASVQATVAEEAKREREHQQELAKAREEALKIERERLQAEIKMQRESNDRLYEFQRTTNTQMYDLQLKAAGTGGDKGTEMIVKVIQDGLNKADARAHEIAEVKKLEKLIATVGPDNAKNLAMQLMAGGGGIDLGSILGGKRGAAAPAVGDVAAAEPQGAVTGQNGAAAHAAPQGGLMNGLMQKTMETPFFADLLEIWGGHLRMKRPPYLFANIMAGFMLEDKRVELFYDYMAGKTWEELLADFKAKIKPEQTGFFEAADAGKFFDAFIDIIAKRIERDHLQSGIVAGEPRTEAPAQ